MRSLVSSVERLAMPCGRHAAVTVRRQPQDTAPERRLSGRARPHKRQQRVVKRRSCGRGTRTRGARNWCTLDKAADLKSSLCPVGNAVAHTGDSEPERLQKRPAPLSVAKRLTSRDESDAQSHTPHITRIALVLVIVPIAAVCQRRLRAVANLIEQDRSIVVVGHTIAALMQNALS